MTIFGHVTWRVQTSVCSSLLLSNTDKCYYYTALPLNNWMNKYGAMVEWDWLGQIKVLRENPVPLPVCTSQITRWMAWGQTWAFTVCGQQLIAWAKALPMYNQFWPLTVAVCVLQQNRRLKYSKQLHHTIHRTSAAVAVVSHNNSSTSFSIQQCTGLS